MLQETSLLLYCLQAMPTCEPPTGLNNQQQQTSSQASIQTSAMLLKHQDKQNG